MRCASCGFENPDGMEFCGECATPLRPFSSVSTASPLPALTQAPSSYAPRHLTAKLLTSHSALEGQRKQVTVDPDVMEKTG
jgi:zinc-ribbon domain